MDIPSITSLESLSEFLMNGTDGLFFSVLMLPVFFIILVSLRVANVGDSVDCLNLTSLVCLLLSFVLSSVGLINVMIVGIFLVMLLIGLILRRFMS